MRRHIALPSWNIFQEVRRQEELKYDEAEDVGPRGLRYSQLARGPRLHVQGNHELHQIAVH